MADKEERILCNSYDGIQAKLMANNNIGMTRREAIEVISNALKVQSGDCVYDAENILNELLGRCN